MAFLLYCLHATKKRALEGKTAYKSRVLAKEFAQKSNIFWSLGKARSVGSFFVRGAHFFQESEPGEKHQYQSEPFPHGEIVELLNALPSGLSGTETQEKVQSRKHPQNADKVSGANSI